MPEADGTKFCVGIWLWVPNAVWRNRVFVARMAALTCMAMAQDFNGVSLGGTTLQPILINNSGQAVIGYVIRRDTTTGVSAPFAIFP